MALVEDIRALMALETPYLHTDELPWVSDGHVAHRLLQVREEDHLVVTNFRTAPGVVSPLHRHLGPAFVYTISGTWGHRPDEMDYRAGTYVVEPTGAVHRYHGGPTVVECIGFSFGDTEAITEDGDVLGRATLKGKVDRYFQMCEEQGFGRPKLLD
jgi:quercetin dioxygenase-like cupin family protein